jgi:hypothetical protein
VDVVGVNPSQKPYWENLPVANYWKDSSPIRKSAKFAEVKFEGTSQIWTLTLENPIWKTWRDYGSAYLMIIADLPGGPFGEGPFDRRRLIVPLDKNSWKPKNKTLEFEVQDAMITALTPQTLAK